jgi:hypothetical protein
MRALFILCVSAYALAACDPAVRITKREETSHEGEPVRAVSELNCPEHQGDLTRTETAADGLSCTYAGPRGAEVTLQLVHLAEGQSASEALAPFEVGLRALMPHTVERAGDSPLVSVQSGGDSTRVRLPGVSVDEGGGRSSVRIGPILIESDASETDADHPGETVSVNANDNAAEVRTRSEGDALRATYILTDEEASEAGWRLVGYEARGPVAGPIVIAVVHSKDRDEDVVFDAAKDLVSLNVGGSL